MEYIIIPHGGRFRQGKGADVPISCASLHNISFIVDGGKAGADDKMDAAEPVILILIQKAAKKLKVDLTFMANGVLLLIVSSHP